MQNVSCIFCKCDPSLCPCKSVSAFFTRTFGSIRGNLFPQKPYAETVATMSLNDLLGQMEAFNAKRFRIKGLSAQMMEDGQVLFRALANKAQYPEMRNIFLAYAKHLDFELIERNTHGNVYSLEDYRAKRMAKCS